LFKKNIKRKKQVFINNVEIRSWAGAGVAENKKN
jgi:hypothetical protein